MYVGFWTSDVVPKQKSHGRFFLDNKKGIITITYDGEYNSGRENTNYINPKIINTSKSLYHTDSFMITINVYDNKEFSGTYQSENDSGTFFTLRNSCCSII